MGEAFRTAFSSAFQQAFTLFVLMMIGYLCGKLRYCGEETRKSLSNILLFITTPAMILEAFQFEYSSDVLKNMGVVAVISAGVIIGAVYLAKLIYKDKPAKVRRVLIYGSAFGNVGFLGLPLMQGLLGDIGVIYASVFVATFNIITWTLGMALWTGEKTSVKKIVTNPTLIAVFIGLLMFCFSIKFPTIIAKPISMLSSCNSPMSMIVIGAILAECSFLDLFRNRLLYGLTAIRLLLVPACTLVICLLLKLSPIGISDEVAYVLILASGTPAAVNTAIFATKYEGDEKLASMAVALNTLLFLPVVLIWVSVFNLIW